MATALLRAWIYDYLSQLFDGDLEHLPEPVEAGIGPSRLATAVDDVRAAMAGATRETVLTDHARLFVNAAGGVAAPPYASWYLDRQLLGPSCRRVEQAYAAQGLQRTVDAGEPADYIGAELEFMHFLARHELAARSTGDAEALRVVLEREAEFVLDHVARWLPDFIARIRTAGPGPVFEAAASLLAAALQDEVSRLSTCRSKPVASVQAE